MHVTILRMTSKNELQNDHEEKLGHLKGLNSRQKEAALHRDGPLLILAGAGAGKTKTITHRILNLILGGVLPEQILAITFTNKAAKEMKQRVESLILSTPEVNRPVTRDTMPFVSTFHSLGVHILREQSSRLDLPRFFTIYDRADSKQAIKEAMGEVGVDPKQFEPGKILGIISREKGEAHTPESFSLKEGGSYVKEIVFEVWEAYERILKNDKALDFDDLLLKTLQLLQIEEVRNHYQGIWSHIHIDEYQDTNKVQYEISKLLAGEQNNIAVVGDIDQSIYSWRGADFKNIMRFEEDYPDATVILLEENYRSTKTIIEIANQAIEKNVLRKKKTLFTNKEEGDLVSVYAAFDERDEADYVARQAKMLVRQGIPAQEIAVLYRANFQSRILEEAFLREQISYDLIGTKFFERKEVKDALSYLRLALNEASVADLKRALGTPSRGIGKVTLAKIVEKKEEELRGSQRQILEDFRSVIAAIKMKALSVSPSETMKYILTASGIESLYRKGNEEDLERLENLKELVSIAASFDNYPPEEGIGKFLEHSSLASDQDEITEDKQGVKLMTVHAAKGLEFEYVFIVGLEENLFPHKRENENRVTKEETEEERRLFYVAVTRAKKKLYLCHSSSRMIYGSREYRIPSEFLVEIDEEKIMRENGSGGRKFIYFDL